MKKYLEIKVSVEHGKNGIDWNFKNIKNNKDIIKEFIWGKCFEGNPDDINLEVSETRAFDLEVGSVYRYINDRNEEYIGFFNGEGLLDIKSFMKLTNFSRFVLKETKFNKYSLKCYDNKYNFKIEKLADNISDYLLGQKVKSPDLLFKDLDYGDKFKFAEKISEFDGLKMKVRINNQDAYMDLKDNKVCFLDKEASDSSDFNENVPVIKQV